MLRNVVKKLSVRNYSTQKNLTDVQINENGIATLIMNKRPVNSLDYLLSNEIINNLNELEKDGIKGLILKSSLNNVFCAGLDINGLYNKSKSDSAKMYREFLKMWLKLYSSTFPTVAIISGHAPAGGCAISLACEHRIMLDNFTIGINEVLLGLSVPEWLLESMKNATNARQCEIACTTGDLFKSMQAHEIGLVDQIADNIDDANEKANAFLNRFTKINYIARNLTKQSIRGPLINKLSNNFESSVDSFIGEVRSDDTQKVIGNYLEQLKNKKK